MDSRPAIDSTLGDPAGAAPRVTRAPLAACLSLAIAVVAIALVWRNTLMRPDLLGYGLNHYSEWLINYAGGFVRRGLAGEIIHRLAGGGPAIAIANTLVFTTFLVLCLGLSAILAATTRRAALVALVLLAPGSILGMAIGNDYYYRKEALFHAHLMIAGLVVIALAGAGDRRIKEVLYRVLVALVVLATLVLPWVHETFIFLSLPAHLLLLHLAARHLERHAGRLLASLVIISVVIFLVEAVFKGSQETAMAIFRSLHVVDRTLINPADPTVPTAGGIGALGWPLKRALGDVLAMLTTGYMWFWLAPLALVAVCAGLLARLAVEERGQRPQTAWWYIDLYLIIVVASAPLYLLAIDWGRWISSGFLGFVVVLMACLQLEAAQGRRFAVWPEREPRSLRLVRAAPRLLVAGAVPLVLLASLLVKMPECCIIGYDQTLLGELKRVLTGK